MSAISSSSFSFRTGQTAAATSRGNTYGNYNTAGRSGTAATTGRSSTTTTAAVTGRSSNTLNTATRTSTTSSNVYGRNSSGTTNTGTGSAYCPTCGGNVSRSASGTSSSYCPTCNRAGGTQSNVAASRATVTSTADHAHTFGQGGRVCVTCGYQAR